MAMPTTATLVEPKRRPGNPNWGRPMLLMPRIATEFEQLVCRLRLTKEMYTSSHELYVWCRTNRNRVYIPEWLLQHWNLNVGTTFGTAA